jgi:hypothetical protein
MHARYFLFWDTARCPRRSYFSGQRPDPFHFGGVTWVNREGREFTRKKINFGSFRIKDLHGDHREIFKSKGPILQNLDKKEELQAYSLETPSWQPAPRIDGFEVPGPTY